MHLLIRVVSYIAIIAHERNRTVLNEFGRYIQTLVVLLGLSFKYSGISKIIYFYNIRRYWLIRLWGRNTRFFIFVYLFRRWLIILMTQSSFRKIMYFIVAGRSFLLLVFFLLNLYRSCVLWIFTHSFLRTTYISSVKNIC